jgi:hypothetical protein
VRRYVLKASFNGKMSCVQAVHLCFGKILEESLAACGSEEDVSLTQKMTVFG